MQSTVSKIKSVAFAVCVAQGIVVQAANAADMSVKVSGARAEVGQVICRVFDARSDFPKNGAFDSIRVTPVGGIAVCDFVDLASGSYAVAVAHDEDSDGKLDTNFLGIPTEGFGFSQNPRTLLGPPDFDEAAVSIGDEPMSIDIKLKY